MMQMRYLSQAKFSEYADVSRITLKKWMQMGMPSYQVGGRVLIDTVEFHGWLQRYRIQTQGADPDMAVSDIWESVMEECK